MTMAFNFAQAEFDMWASEYDADAAHKTKWVAHNLVAQAALQFAPQMNVQRITDLGTGTGLLIPALKAGFNKATIVGVDLSENMLEECRKKDIADELIQFDLGLEDWADLPQKKSQLVVSSGLLEFLKDSQSFISNAADMLEPESILIMTYQPPQIAKGPISAAPTYSRPHHKMAEQFKQAGLKMLQQTEFEAYRHFGVPVSYGLVAAMKPSISAS